MRRKVTARDVAAMAETSTAAVSRAFAANGVIAPVLRDRILRAAADLGYQPPATRAMARLTTGTITLVAGDLENPFYPMAVNALSQAILSRGRRMVLQPVLPGSDVDAVMEQVLAFPSDAVIVTSALMSSRIARACRDRRLPVVLFNRVQPDARMTAVTCDNCGGGRLVAQRFLESGRRRVALIGGKANTSTHLERTRGFLDRLDQAKVALTASVSGDYDYATSLQAARALLTNHPAPDAIFCVNDVMALAAIDAARALCLSVPEDVAIIGFDDVSMAGWAAYGLTTVRQPIADMAAAAMDLVEAQLANPAAEGAIRVLPVELVLRDSG